MIKPVGKRVLVQLVQIEQSRKSGIIVSSSLETQNIIAKVIEVGDVALEKETLVYINKSNALKLEDSINDLYIVEQEDILAKIIN